MKENSGVNISLFDVQLLMTVLTLLTQLLIYIILLAHLLILILMFVLPLQQYFNPFKHLPSTF